jgi:ubiquinone/menaquinone biosynthesis C-methylase UbiE
LLGRRELVRQPQDESGDRTQFESQPSLSMANEIGIISMMLPRMAIPLGTVLFAQRLSSSLQRRLRIERKGPPSEVRSFRKYLPYIEGKNGLEIGGPTGIFREGDIVPVYGHIGTLDNCDFSISTAWAKHTQSFEFNPRKAPGKTFFCDGSALTPIGDSTYDVLLSSHNLEHFANPVKALKEWRRVLRPGGALILILPFYKATFDHRRKPTSVEHMLNDFEVKMGEDDLTHLPEILEKHDLACDVGAGTPEEFHKRSLDNFSNRCLHHHVFDEHNSRKLLSRCAYEVLALDFRLPSHMCILARAIS